jgi:hypothetical protein
MEEAKGVCLGGGTLSRNKQTRRVWFAQLTAPCVSSVLIGVYSLMGVFLVFLAVFSEALGALQARSSFLHIGVSRLGVRSARSRLLGVLARDAIGFIKLISAGFADAGAACVAVDRAGFLRYARCGGVAGLIQGRSGPAAQHENSKIQKCSAHNRRSRLVLIESKV